MKKVYQKPQLLIENFMVSDYIATCTDNITFSNNTQCQDSYFSDEVASSLQLWATMGYFQDSSSCNQVMSLEDFVESFGGELCLHNPTGQYRVFSS